MWRDVQRWFSGGYIIQKGWINKLNNIWTPAILVMLSVASVIARYVESPVNCWCPAEFNSAMVSYTNYYCWLSHRMYQPLERDVPIHGRIHDLFYNPSLNRWIPLILLLQAISFKLPGIIMYVGESKLGFKRNKLYGLSDGYTTLSLQDRENMGKQLGRYLNQWLKNRILTGLPFGLLTFLIVIVYVLYVVNITVQIIAVDHYIKDPNVTTYGTHLLHNLFANRSGLWIQSPVFTKVFMCDFRIRKLTNLQHYTVQCINNLNFVYEQIFAFVWIWLAFTAVITYCSCALKAVELILPFIRTRYIKQYLQSENVTIHNENDISRFANNVLGEDGVMVLKGIGEVSSEYLVRDAVINLWISNFGQRGLPQQQVNQPIQNTIQQRPVSQPCYNHMSSAGATGDTREETMPLVQYPPKRE